MPAGRRRSDDDGSRDREKEGGEPAIVSRKDAGEQQPSAANQRPLRFALLGLAQVAHEIGEQHRRPQEQRQLQRLGHGGRLQVEQVGIGAEHHGAEPGGEARGARIAASGESVVQQAKEAEHGSHISDQRRNGAADAGAPKLV